MIVLDHVTYTYPGTKSPALKDISLTIADGQFCAVIGPNGAGKSTLAYTIAGFVPHFYRGTLTGRVMVEENDTQIKPLSDLVTNTGLIFQNPFNQISGTKFTVREEIAFGLENLGLPRDEMLSRVEETLALMGISDLSGRSPLALSGGQMQRVAIASVLAMRPQVLVLDEPTSQLDPIGSREVFNAVRELMMSRKMTVVMIEHKLEWVAGFADRAIAMAGGQILADGRPAEVLTDESLIAYGVGQTRYTQAARRARELNIWPAGKPLPVTLEEAVEGFQATMDGKRQTTEDERRRTNHES
jgi:energy-coupling factor transporter ATP-binding protein EcfA2